MINNTGQKLRSLRGKRTLQEVADAANITPAALSNYEQGIRTPRPEVMVRLAKYFGKSVGWLFFDEKSHKTCDIDALRDIDEHGLVATHEREEELNENEL